MPYKLTDMKKAAIILYHVLLTALAVYLWLPFFNAAKYHLDLRKIVAQKDELSQKTFDPKVMIVYENDTVYAANEFHYQVEQLNKKLDERAAFLNSYDEVDILLGLSLLSGLIGGVIRWLMNIAYRQGKSFDATAYILPILSAIAGLLSFLIVKVFPQGMLNKMNFAHIGAYVLISIVAGIFAEIVFNKIKKYVQSIQPNSHE